MIMCGGSGTRLWPLSRNKLPKQFIKLTDDKYTMFQLSCIKVKDLNYNKMIIVCNEQHKFLAQKQLEELNIDNYQIIAEPMGRNTAAAIASSCLILDDTDNLLVMAADHIWDDKKFCECVNQGLNLVNQGIVVFGIKPTYAETGYGYINYEGDNLIKFVEKPNAEKAKEYLESGNYLWNSGNFLFNVGIMKNEFNLHAKDISDAVVLTLGNSTFSNKSINLNKEYFEKVRDKSIDYAIMEHHTNGKVVQYDGYWSDIGSFLSLHQHLEKDENGNVIEGDVKTIDTTNSLIKSENRLITTLGIDNLVVIDTRDTLFIGDKNRSYDVKLFANELKKENRSEHDIHAKAYRPWGWYMNIEGNDNSGFKVKRICVYPGKRLSLQSHNHRSEHWVIVKGTARVQVGKDYHNLDKNQSVYIPIGVLHRMENNSDDEVEFVETQIGDYLGEDDIVRYEDDFGRV